MHSSRTQETKEAYLQTILEVARRLISWCGVAELACCLPITTNISLADCTILAYCLDQIHYAAVLDAYELQATACKRGGLQLSVLGLVSTSQERCLEQSHSTTDDALGQHKEKKFQETLKSLNR
jgi:hypothetical protein